ncbi:tyrosine-type recombinase/integrase [Caulobacter flavus]|nr:tyrosine-type recombinase/integrase [Caulobacter flavus]
MNRSSNGTVRIYWYRTRGGEQIGKFVGASYAEAIALETAGAQEVIAAYARKPERPEANAATLRGVIVRYKASPTGFLRLADKTKVNWRRSLDLIDAKFGNLTTKAVSAKGVKKAMIAWRDGFKDTPRQADAHMTVLKRLLSWAVENEEIEKNPIERVEGIYKSNRAALIVEPDALEAILERATPEAQLAIRFAAATGVRREDLCEIEWSFLRENHLLFPTNKSSGRKIVRVPLLGEAWAVVEELKKQREQAIAEGRVPSAFMFVTDRKTPWKPDSLTQAFARAAKAAGVVGRRLNDLRGTAITKFVVAGFDNDTIADIVGWEVTRVANIRKHYVDSWNVAERLMQQLERSRQTG